MSELKNRAVLMRLNIGMPGENRQDTDLSEKVKAEHALGQKAGKWIKQLYPPVALEPIKKLDNEARAYHGAVTLPFDNGIGILPAALIMEYSEKMKEFASRRAHLVDTHFLARYAEWVEWARVNHNGTFDESLYPGADEVREKFYFKTEPIPVPDSKHFETNVASLLGVDTDSVDARVADAEKKGQAELLKRMIGPVKHMVDTLKKDAPRIFDTLTGNIAEIADLAPKLNITGDAAIDGFAAELKTLTRWHSDVLRNSGKATRDEARAAAERVLEKLNGYKL